MLIGKWCRLDKLSLIIVSGSPPRNIKQTVKEHFARDQEQETSDFKTFPVSQRSQFHDYVDGIINLSQMSDPELPGNDS